MKKEYKVITGKGAFPCSAEEKLTKEVNDLLSNGWELQGGVSTMYATSLDKYYFSQALVREIKE